MEWETAFPPEGDDEDDRYPMRSKPGFCVVINNRNFTTLQERRGSEKDKDAVIRTFGQLGFTVKPYDEKSGEEIIDIITKYSKDPALKGHDCFVACIMSHGAQGQVYGTDGVPVNIKDLTSLVKPAYCRYLTGKPKIFFIQACQGDGGLQTGHQMSGSDEMDSSRPLQDKLIPADSDFFLGYSTVPGYGSVRNTVDGSRYIKHLADCLDRFANREELHHIVLRVHQAVAKEGGPNHKQTPYKYSTMRKKLYFPTPALLRFDPMSASPPSGVTIESRAGSDRQKPWITSLVVDHSSAFIFMTDFANNSIKVASLETGQLVSTLPLDVEPWSAALIGEKELVVTAPLNKAIILVDVTDKRKLVVQNKISTERNYWSVCAVPSTGGDVTLVVSCDKDEDGPASVDVITVDGTCIKNIINSKKLPKLYQPRFLCVHDNHLYIPDYSSKCVFKLELNTGVVVDTLTHPDMKYPSQLCTDSVGHLYVASFGGECVLVRSVDGRWRKLLTGEEHGEREGRYVCPRGLSVSPTGLVVSWVSLGVTVVKKYDLV